MSSVNSVEFLNLWEELLKNSHLLPELERLVDAGLDLNEKLRYYDDGTEEEEVIENKSLLYLSLIFGPTELTHFLVSRVDPDRETIELCARQFPFVQDYDSTTGKFSLRHESKILENRKFLEEMLKRYEGEIEYWIAHDHLELFLGFGVVDLHKMVYREEYTQPLFPIEVAFLSSVCNGISMDRVKLLKQNGSPPIRESVVLSVAHNWFDELYYGDYHEKLRYQTMMKKYKESIAFYKGI